MLSCRPRHDRWRHLTVAAGLQLFGGGLGRLHRALRRRGATVVMVMYLHEALDKRLVGDVTAGDILDATMDGPCCGSVKADDRHGRDGEPRADHVERRRGFRCDEAVPPQSSANDHVHYPRADQ